MRRDHCVAVVAFDTLKAAKRMTDAGMERRQAEEFASVLGDQIAADRAELATKQDVAQFQAATKQDFAQFQAATKQDLVQLEARLEAKIDSRVQSLETKMEAKFADQYMRLLTAIVAVTGLGVAIIKLFP
jgi:hypothetical protein